MCTPATALESALMGTHTFGAPQQITDSVTAEPITRTDGYRYGWRLTCADCGDEQCIGRHTTVFDGDIPEMFAANHGAACADKPLL